MRDTAKACDTLPLHIRQTPTLSKFIKYLKTWLLYESDELPGAATPTPPALFGRTDHMCLSQWQFKCNRGGPGGWRRRSPSSGRNKWC
ncbi:uncharacterized protein LOC144782751 isoform X2 [Lissotriton helveticus]